MVFFILWILGLVGVYAIGAWIWLFFAIWIISLIAQMAAGRGRGTPAAPPTMPKI